MRHLLTCLALLPLAGALAGPTFAQAPTPLTLDQVMADPDWIGSGVEDAWWSWDGKHAYYTRKRDGGNIRDTFSQAIEGGTAARLDGAALAGIDGEQQVRSEEHTSELQSLMRISYAVFCLKKNTMTRKPNQ